MRLPIRVRMTAWYVTLLAVIVAAVGAFLVVRLRADLTRSIDRALGPAAAQIAAGYRAEGRAEFEDTAATVLGGERAAAQALDPDGRVHVAYGDPVSRAPMVGAGGRAAVLGGRVITRTVALGARRERFRLVARSVRRRGRPRIVVAAESLAPVTNAARRALTLLLIAGPAALLATALGGWWLATRSLRPIRRMTATAEAIGAQRLDDRLAVSPANDEVAQLGRTLNTMLDRIEQGMDEQQRLVARQRRFVADSSHELRTPLAVMLAEIDVSLRADDLPAPAREVLESTREEVRRMSRTVEDLLTLATADEGGLALLAVPIDLHASAGRVVDELGALARRRGVAVALGGAQAILVGDPPRLEHALRNVVENAIDFSPAGGRVELETTAADGTARLTVADEGPGIPADHRDRVFDRFHRVDPARRRSTGGNGLGLAIAREIIEAHDGRISVAARRPRGSVFSIALPLADP